MADDGIFIKNADIQARAGTNANATAKATAATDVYVLDVESFINVTSKYNFSDAYAGLNADVKELLVEAGASLCAIKVIMWDMSGYTNLSEAQTMIDILYTNAQDALRLLKEKQYQTFMGDA